MMAVDCHYIDEIMMPVDCHYIDEIKTTDSLQFNEPENDVI